MFYMDEAEQKISDAIDAYERECMRIMFPHAYKSGYIMWGEGKTDKPMGWKCYAYVYDWQFATIHAQYQGGP
jgi:hypothetical protein